MAPSLRETLARAAYSTLLRLVTPLYLARLWWRGRHEPAYRLAWRERLGGMDSASGEPPSGRLWLHAVSLGETRAAAALIDALREALPGLPLLLTCGTARPPAARPARRCCARAMPRSGCPTTHPARCGASCVTTGPWPA